MIVDDGSERERDNAQFADWWIPGIANGEFIQRSTVEALVDLIALAEDASGDLLHSLSASVTQFFYSVIIVQMTS
jgi:hypothetical protein